MASYHCTVKIIGRSSNRSSRSAVASSAYRSGKKIINEYDGVEHDYQRKKGIVHTEIMKPDHAPEWANDRSKLWNEVEKIEKNSNSQLAREIEFSLPVELNRENQIELIRDYVKENFVDRGMVADVSVHDKGDGNPHAHVMLTMRPFNEDGTWGAKSKKEYILDKNGEKIYSKNGEVKSKKIELTDWNDKERIQEWRANLATKTNEFLERNGFDRSHFIDHRSYEEQGIDKIPTKHMGKAATQIEKRGGKSILGDINREIREQNKQLEELKKEYEKVQEEYKKELEKAKEREQQESEILLHQQQQQQHIIQQNMKPIEEVQPNNNGLDNSHGFSEHYSDVALKSSQAIAYARDQMHRAEVEELAKERASKLYNLKQNFKDLEIKRLEVRDIQGKQRQQVQTIDRQVEGISEIKNSMLDYETRIRELKEIQEKNSGVKGLFKFKEKQNIDEKIKMLENSKQQALTALKLNYNILTYQDIDKVTEKLKQQQEQYSKFDTNAYLQDIEKRQQQIELEYKKLLVDKEIGHEDFKYRVDYNLKELEDSKTETQGKRSLHDKKLDIDIDRRLNTLYTKDKEQIYKSLQREEQKEKFKNHYMNTSNKNINDLSR